MTERMNRILGRSVEGGAQTTYYRQFTLPQDIETDSADAHFENDVLTVTFDRKKLPQPKRLKLTSGKKSEKYGPSKIESTKPRSVAGFCVITVRWMLE